MSCKLHVLVVDSHAMFCDGLRAILEGQPDMLVTGDAVDVAGAVKHAIETPPDVIVLDACLPQRGALDVISQVLAERPQASIIVLAAYPDEELVQACIRTGAQGCLLKTNRAVVLVDAIRSIAAGGAVIDPLLAPSMLTDYRRLTKTTTREDVPTSSLSTRELNVLRLLVHGATNQEIAEKLSLSPQTIRNRLSGIYRKLGVENRTEATAFVLHHGLIQAE